MCASLAGCGPVTPPEFSADRVVTHVERQVAYGPRVPGTAARDSAAVYLTRELERAGASVSAQTFSIDDPYSERPLRLINVTASFSVGREPRILLAAHYDTRPWADEDPDSTKWLQPVPGAVDGACGAGILLEIARAVGARDPGDVGVDVVFFDGEDYGRSGDYTYYLIGSQYFAGASAGYRPAAVILIDMVGGVGTKVRREALSDQKARPVMDWVFARAGSLGLTYFESTPGAPMYDDHVPLQQVGMPAINLFGYGYKAWHTLADDLSQLDRDAIQQVGTLLTSLIYDFDLGE